MPSPSSVEATASALEALQLMSDHVIRHLPVVDAQRRVVGVLSLNDLRAGLPFSHDLSELSSEQRRWARRLSVGELMSHAPETASADEPLESAARRMAERGLGCLPVVDAAGQLTGIFTETDAMRALVGLISAIEEVPADDAAGLEATLRRERWRLRRALERSARTERERTEQRHDEPGDAGDAGELRAEEIIEEPLAALMLQRLAELDHALARAARGQLGICETCAGRIPAGRIRALPGVTQCIACARSAERRASAAQRERPLPLPAAPGTRMHTPQGEAQVLRIAPFGTCGECGETEGIYDDASDAVLCSRPGCEMPLEDVEELAVVSLGEETAAIRLEKLRPVDPAPYD
jgi:CBS domain-containing protein/RNA polymerase-binding transcription factor DksA